MKVITYLLLLLLPTSSVNIDNHNNRSSYEMKGIKSWVSGTNFACLFEAEPKIQDFKLYLGSRISYRINDLDTINSDISVHKGIKIEVYGNHTLKEKNISLYDQVKDVIDTTNKNYLILVKIHDLTENHIDCISIKYGLWESYNTDIKKDEWFLFKPYYLELSH